VQFDAGPAKKHLVWEQRNVIRQLDLKHLLAPALAALLWTPVSAAATDAGVEKVGLLRILMDRPRQI
jgi:hypothetical protein